MYLVFDIGGTQMRGASSTNGQTLANTKIVPSVNSYPQGLAALVALSQELAGGEQIKAVAIAIAGIVDNSTNLLGRLGNLTGWSQRPLAIDYEREFGIAPLLRNDAEMAGLAEMAFGAGKDYVSIVYLTIGTGVGGAWIHRDGEKIISENIEAGHILTVDPSGPECKVCGKVGDIETMISGAGLAHRFHKPAAEISDPVVWQEAGRLAALAIFETMKIYPSEAAIIGGGIVAKNRIPLDIIEQELERLNSKPISVHKAALGDQAGLYGALKTILDS